LAAGLFGSSSIRIAELTEAGPLLLIRKKELKKKGGACLTHSARSRAVPAGRFLILGGQFFVDALCRGGKPQRGRRIALNIDHIAIISCAASAHLDCFQAPDCQRVRCRALYIHPRPFIFLRALRNYSKKRKKKTANSELSESQPASPTAAPTKAAQWAIPLVGEIHPAITRLNVTRPVGLMDVHVTCKSRHKSRHFDRTSFRV